MYVAQFYTSVKVKSMIELKITANSVEELRDIASKVAASNGVSTEIFEAKLEAVTSTPVDTTEIFEVDASVITQNIDVAPTPETVGGDMLPPPEGQSAADTGTGATLAPAPAAELDERGVPWSADFHAATKTKTQDGAWKKKRGGDHEALAAYEAQFTSVTPATATGAVPVPAPNANMSMPGQGGVMPQPDLTPEVEPTAAPVLDATKIMEVASGLINGGKASPAYLQELAEAGGLGSIGEMFNRDDALPAISAKLQADGHI